MKKQVRYPLFFISMIAVLVMLPLQVHAADTGENTPPNHIFLSDIFATPSQSMSEVLYGETGDIVQITDSQPDQNGAIWSTQNNLMDLTQDFESQMYIYFGSNGTQAADGMAFVMHNDPRGTEAMNEGNGASLGVWDSEQAGEFGKAIQNSFAVEFDTHDNEEFDKDVDSQDHIAWNYPDQESSYKDSGIIFKNRKLIHEGVQYPGELATDQWHSFHVKWNAANQALTYQFDLLEPVTVNIDTTSIFEGATSVYWGFTGSTGDQVEMNRVVFEHVPGLVQANVVETITNEEGQAIHNQKVWSNDPIYYEICAEYVAGKQEWMDVQLTKTLNQFVTYVPGSLQLIRDDGSKESLPDTAWNGKNLSVALGDLGENSKKVSIQFEAIPQTVSSLVQVEEVSLFSGRNYLAKSEKRSFSIENPTLSISLENEGNTEDILSGTEYVVNGNWQFSKEQSVKITPMIGEKELPSFIEENKSPGEVFTFTNKLAKDTLDLGENRLTYRIESSDGRHKATSQLLLVNVREKPELSLEKENQVVTIAPENELSFSGTWMDKDSESATLYYVLDEDAPVNFGESIINSEKGKPVDYVGQVAKEKLTIGTHQLTVYAVDSEGFESEKKELTIVVSGKLHFTHIDSVVSFAEAQIGEQKVNRLGEWSIQVQDSRSSQNQWQLSVKLDQEFQTQEGKVLSGELLYVDDDGNQTPITTEEFVTVYTSSSVSTDVVNVGWANNRGILLDTYDSAYKGSYSSSLSWLLTDGPT